MPSKYEKLNVTKEFDKRIKLSDEDKETIRHKYKTGLYSQRQLAAEYNVSRRLIVFTLYPERQNKVDWSKYYSKEKRKEYQKKHRDHKKELYKQNKI